MRAWLNRTLSLTVLLVGLLAGTVARAQVVGIDRSGQWIPVMDGPSLSLIVSAGPECRGTQVYPQLGPGTTDFGFVVGKTHNESIDLLVYYVQYTGTSLIRVTGQYRAIVFNEQTCESLGDFPLRYDVNNLSVEEWFQWQEDYSGTVMSLDSPPWTVQQPKWEFSEKRIVVDDRDEIYVIDF